MEFLNQNPLVYVGVVAFVMLIGAFLANRKMSKLGKQFAASQKAAEDHAVERAAEHKKLKALITRGNQCHEQCNEQIRDLQQSFHALSYHTQADVDHFAAQEAWQAERLQHSERITKLAEAVAVLAAENVALRDAAETEPMGYADGAGLSAEIAELEAELDGLTRELDELLQESKEDAQSLSSDQRRPDDGTEVEHLLEADE